MSRFLVPVLAGLALFSSALIAAASPSGIGPGGCVLQDVVRGRLFQELVPDNDPDQLDGPSQPRLPIAKVKIAWMLASGDRTYELEFSRNRQLQGMAENLAGQNVVATGVLRGNKLLVAALQGDGLTLVQITGSVQQDMTEILRPYQVTWYISSGGQNYYLHFAGNKELQKVASTAKGSVTVAGELEIKGRWLIVHVHSLKPAAKVSIPLLEERVYEGGSEDSWLTENTVFALTSGDRRPMVDLIRGLLADDLKDGRHNVRVEGSKLVVRTTAANHARIRDFLHLLAVIPAQAR